MLLFDIPTEHPNKFCRTCKHRVKHSYFHSLKVMQYCSKRTGKNQFGLMRIKVTNTACPMYEEIREVK